MAKPRSAEPLAPRSARRKAALGPGLHPGFVEAAIAVSDAASRSGPGYRVRLADGRLLTATLLAGVAPAFVDECLREGRTVILMDTPSGAAIAGALQTSSSPAPDARGTLALEARHLRLRASETVEIEVPGSSLRIEPGGAVRLEGDRMVIDMAALVRIFSARVEIP